MQVYIQNINIKQVHISVSQDHLSVIFPLKSNCLTFKNFLYKTKLLQAIITYTHGLFHRSTKNTCESR